MEIPMKINIFPWDKNSPNFHGHGIIKLPGDIAKLERHNFGAKKKDSNRFRCEHYMKIVLKYIEDI